MPSDEQHTEMIRYLSAILSELKSIKEEIAALRRENEAAHRQINRRAAGR